MGAGRGTKKRVFAKTTQRQAAQVLRSQGGTIPQIAKSLRISQSTASGWVKDIPLSDARKKQLAQNRVAYAANASKAMQEKHRKLREQYRKEGRVRAAKQDPLHEAGCMLYWAEGGKDRSTTSINNTDVELLKFFMKFLRANFKLEDDKIAIEISVYLNNGI